MKRFLQQHIADFYSFDLIRQSKPTNKPNYPSQNGKFVNDHISLKVEFTTN